MRPKHYASLIVLLLAMVVVLKMAAEYPASAKSMRIVVKDGYLELYGETSVPGQAPDRGVYEVLAPVNASLKKHFFVQDYAALKNVEGLVITINYGSLAPEKLFSLMLLVAASAFLLGFSAMYLSSNWGEALEEWARVKGHVLMLAAGHYTALSLTILNVEALRLLNEGNPLYTRLHPLLFYVLGEFVLISFLVGVYSLLILGRVTHRLIYYAARATLFTAALLFALDGVHDALMLCRIEFLGQLFFSAPGFILFTTIFVAYTAYKVVRGEDI